MKNFLIRERIKQSGLTHWEVAEALGVSEFTFCRWLRKEIEGERLEQVMNAIAVAEVNR